MTRARLRSEAQQCVDVWPASAIFPTDACAIAWGLFHTVGKACRAASKSTEFAVACSALGEWPSGVGQGMNGRCADRCRAVAASAHVRLLVFLLALTGLWLIDAREAQSRNNSHGSRHNAQPAPRNNSRDNERQSNRNEREKDRDRDRDKDRDRDDDDDESGRQARQGAQHRADKNNKDADDDTADGSNGRKDSGSARSDRASRAQNNTPPDNLVDWWKWVTKPAAPAPVARNKDRPSVESSATRNVRGASAPDQKSSAAEPKAPEPAGDGERTQWEAVTKVGASPSDKDATDKRQARLPDEKAAAKKIAADVPTAVRFWASRMPPPPGAYSPQEVLAFNLTPAARERLRQMGYTARATSVSGLTQVSLPEGVDAWTAQRRLEAELQHGFSLNYLYDHYVSGQGYAVLDSAPIEAEVVKEGSKGCRTERCYGRRVIGWQDQLAACAKGVKVGMIDTGYDARHPSFKGLNARVVMEDTANRAPDWHGTGVLSLLASDAESSTPGLVPDAEFLIADAFFQNSFGRARTDTARVLEALQRLEEHGAQVINMSLVGPSDDLVHDRIADMSTRKGVVFVAAAGNGGPAAPPGYPAAYKEVIAVTAVDDRKRTYDYANRGRYIDVAAPGVRIWTALPDRKEGMLNGTSFAAPFVTAVAAVTYNSTPLRAQLAEGRLPLDPKGAMLAAFRIERLGNGERNEQYGLGLVKAPSSCGPATPPTLATLKKPPAAEAELPWQNNITQFVVLH